MRRWLIGASLLVALVGLGIAFAVPSTLFRTALRPSSGFKCIYMTDVRPWVRFAVGAATVLPGLILLGTRLRPSRALATAVVIAGTAFGILLWRIDGPVPATGGDCVVYPRRYMTGHPYGGPAFLILLMTAALAFRLWPHEPWISDQVSRRPRSMSSPPSR